MQCTLCMHEQLNALQGIPRHDRGFARVYQCILQVLMKVVPFLKERAFHAFVKMCQNEISQIALRTS